MSHGIQHHCTAPMSAPGKLLGGGVREGGGKTAIILAHQGEKAELGSGLTRAGLFLQGHLNWPPFCLVMLNVTHLTHQVIIDRFSRKVSASEELVLQAEPGRQSVGGSVSGGEGPRGLFVIGDRGGGGPS